MTAESRPFDTERMLRAAGRLRGCGPFGSDAEEEAFLRDFADRSLAEVQAEAGMDATEEAQELAFQAMEASETTRGAELARRALELDSGCLDAHGVLAAAESHAPAEFLSRLGSLPTPLEALDPLTTQAYSGRLWGVLGARPLLRARFARALGLERLGRPREAIRAFEELLELDRVDHQQVRYQLIRLYADRRMTKPFARLLRVYATDTGPVMAWARVLERVQAGHYAGAATALSRARKCNPYVEEILTGRRMPPRATGQSALPGSPEEAAAALRVLARPWTGDREAMFWLLKGPTA
jgi:tetratricopeptide (TPR) repeat protein